MGPKAATDDGYERSLGVNYLGHAYLTLLLMDKLHHCAPSKVINVCSDAYTHGQLDFNDLSLLKVCSFKYILIAESIRLTMDCRLSLNLDC